MSDALRRRPPNSPRAPGYRTPTPPVASPVPRAREIFTPAEGPPSNSGVSRELYARMGEANIVRMIHDLYDRLAESSVARLFPRDPGERRAAADKSADFFIFLMGGPPLYQQRHGPPRMRARHLPFEIDEPARQEWLRCFGEVLEDAERKYAFPREHLEGFVDFLVKFSGWMVNAR